MKKQRKKLPGLLLIMGHPRSGTTILNRLCDSHPDIVMTREFVNLRLPQTFQKHTRTIRKNFLQRNKTPLIYTEGTPAWQKLKSLAFLVRYLFWLMIFSRGQVTAEAVTQTLGRLFPQAKLVGDKKPTYIWNLADFQKTDSKLILIYRDGRDVIQSALARSWSGKKEILFSTVKSTAENWVRAVEIMEEYREQVHLIRYEDLVTYPEKELIRLAEYLEVDPQGFQAGMVRYSSVGKYRDALTDEQLAEIHFIAGPTLARLGYDVE